MLIIVCLFCIGEDVGPKEIVCRCRFCCREVILGIVEAHRCRSCSQPQYVGLEEGSRGKEAAAGRAQATPRSAQESRCTVCPVSGCTDATCSRELVHELCVNASSLGRAVRAQRRRCGWSRRHTGVIAILSTGTHAQCYLHQVCLNSLTSGRVTASHFVQGNGTGSAKSLLDDVNQFLSSAKSAAPPPPVCHTCAL